MPYVHHRAAACLVCIQRNRWVSKNLTYSHIFRVLVVSSEFKPYILSFFDDWVTIRRVYTPYTRVPGEYSWTFKEGGGTPTALLGQEHRKAR